MGTPSPLGWAPRILGGARPVSMALVCQRHLRQNRAPGGASPGHPGGREMTWSILARDGQGRFGVAIASRFFAVGALCVHTRRGVGALSTQALMNPLYGADAMDLLAHGHRPDQVVDM